VYIKILEGWRDVTACFVSWRRVTEFTERECEPASLAQDLKIETALAPVPAGAGSGDGGDSIEDHRDEITLVLENQLSTAPQPALYITGLVTRLKLPSNFETQLAGIEKEDPRSSATKLVKWAIGRNVKAGTTVIGVLMAELGEDRGPPDQDRLLELIEQYSLLPEDEIRKRRGT
jgi:hypothetical protein